MTRGAPERSRRGRPRCVLSVAAALLGAAALGGCGAGALQTATAPTDVRPAEATVIYGCRGNGQVRPRTIVLFCADGGAYVSDIRWAHWGTATARGTGRDTVNLCEPDCAAGHYITESVHLSASGLSLSGTAATYTSLTYVGTRGGASRYSLTINGPVLK